MCRFFFVCRKKKTESKKAGHFLYFTESMVFLVFRFGNREIWIFAKKSSFELEIGDTESVKQFEPIRRLCFKRKGNLRRSEPIRTEVKINQSETSIKLFYKI